MSPVSESASLSPTSSPSRTRCAPLNLAVGLPARFFCAEVPAKTSSTEASLLLRPTLDLFVLVAAECVSERVGLRIGWAACALSDEGGFRGDDSKAVPVSARDFGESAMFWLLCVAKTKRAMGSSASGLRVLRWLCVEWAEEGEAEQEEGGRETGAEVDMSVIAYEELGG